MDFNESTSSEISALQPADYVSRATECMQARFSHFIVTPEQIEAWGIGFNWIHRIATATSKINPNWKFHPEFSAPLISGRPDLVIDTGTHLVVVEMKTGFKVSKSAGEKQVLNYCDDIWGKIKIGRSRIVIPVLLKDKNKKVEIFTWTSKIDYPSNVLNLSVESLISLLSQISQEAPASLAFTGENSSLLKYSPRPSVVEAATSLVAALDDRNIVTGLASNQELERLIDDVNKLVRKTRDERGHQIIVISGSPGSGKTLIGLRIAHDRRVQKMLGENVGTPLYLTGNGPLVEVLIESLARDEVRRLGTTKSKSISNASTKVRLIHGITEKKFGIESNVIVFDEGQRIWTESHMQFKKKSESVGSEAYEILTYLEALPWAIAIVLLGEGQEINTGEEGLATWLNAIVKRNNEGAISWQLAAPKIPTSYLGQPAFSEVKDFHLVANQRTDNAANVSDWVSELLKGEFKRANEVRNTFEKFPIYFTRDLSIAKNWLRENAEANQSYGLVASSKSKRLINYGLDPAADANRSFNWASWYLNELPDLNTSKSLEVAATEYKCQGLELDWVGVCWSWDLIMSSNKIEARTLDSGKAKWKKTGKKSSYQINAYRVLLTRARKGMIIWIPRGVEEDPSRSITEMNTVAQSLQEAGLIELK
ncbi:Domain of unknown function DUF2075 [Candidatus Nanopelagicaceae bacterium]